MVDANDKCERCGGAVMVVWDEPLGQLVVCIYSHFDTRPKRRLVLDTAELCKEKPNAA